MLGFGIVAWGNVYRVFPRRLAFGFTPFLVAYTLTQLVGHNTWEAICKFTVRSSHLSGPDGTFASVDMLLFGAVAIRNC